MFDIIIKHGTILDGTGGREFSGDVGIRDDEITAIGDLSGEQAERVINAKGCAVAPGFVDVDNHSDTYWRMFLDPDMESLVRQGITTIIGGSCGASLAPLTDRSMIQSIQKWTDIRNLNLNWLSTKEFLEEVESRKLALNFGTLLGHGTLRRGFVRDESRPLYSPELSGMEKMLKLALREGALGMSLGLTYVHGRHATEHELSALAQIVGKFGGICTTHLRDEGAELPKAIEEVIAMAKLSGVRLHISHLKAVGRRHWENMERALYLLEASDSEGIDVSFDVYPYQSTSSVLYTLLPTWATEGGKRMILERLRDTSSRIEIIHELKEQGIDYSRAFIMSSALDKMLMRTNVLEMAEAEGKSPEEVLLDVVVASDNRARISLDAIGEENMEKAIRHPFSIISSNGAGYSLELVKTNEGVHPRSFGAFPRVLSKYVREKKLLGWEEAIHKMTGKPAKKFGVPRRGTIARGNFADLIVFREEQIADRATVENPYQYPSGIDWVIVNGRVALENGRYLGARSGRVVTRESHWSDRWK